MDDRHQRLLRAAGLVILLWLTAELVMAVTLRVEGYDGYWYLSNAWSLAGGPVHHYEDTKAPLVSLLLVPLLILRRIGAPEIAAFIGAHLVSLAMTAATGWLVARTLARRFARPVAWAGAAAFLGSRVVTRYGVFAMSDIPTTLGILLALELVQRHRERAGVRCRLPFAAAVLAAVLARYPSGLIWPVAVAWDVAGQFIGHAGGSRQAVRRLREHLAGLGILLGAFYLVHLAIYMVPGGGPLSASRSFARMVAHNMRLGGISASTGEAWWEYLPMMAASSTLPVLLLMAIGVLMAVYRLERTDALHGLWVAVHLLFISFVSSHKEIRYALPALPSLYFFAVRGLDGLFGASSRLRAGTPRDSGSLPPGSDPATDPPRPAPAAAVSRTRWVVALLLAAGTVPALREGRMLAQPFFRTPVEANLAAWVDDAVTSPAGRIFWSGNLYPLHPARYVFSPRDEYYYIFHVGPHVFEYYTGRPVLATRRVPAVMAAGVPYPVQMALTVRTGDALLSSVTAVTWTSTLPHPLPPLVYSDVRTWDLVPAAGDRPGWFEDDTGTVTASIETGSHPTLTLRAPPDPTEIVIRHRPDAPVSLGLLFPSHRGVAFDLPDAIDLARIDSIRIAGYRSVPVPGTGSRRP
ncbi:MAG: hypothetical protein ACE5IK_07120 [Acidobacteriota bacterium]